MKKLLYAVVLMFGLCFASCGNGCTSASCDCDSTSVDTVDTVVVDSALVDIVC